MTTNTAYESGDVTVKTCNLVRMSDNIAQDILGQVSTISLFEDLLTPSLYCEVTVVDAIGLLKGLPIVGQEWLDLEFDTPGRDTYKTRLQVKKVAKVQANSNQTKQGYVLECFSPEKIRDDVTIVQKGYNTTIDQIVADLLQSFLKTTKKYFYEPTKGVQHIVVPKKSPFATIDMVRKRAASTLNKSSSYVFYENKYGYNFNTIENLLAKNSSNVGDKIFTKYTSLATEHQTSLEFRNILAYNSGSQFDMHGSLVIGGLNNIHHQFDLLTKSIKSTKYNLNQFSQFSSPDSSGAVSPFTPTFYQMYGSTPAVKYYNIADSGKPDTYINDFMPSKIGFLATYMMGAIDIYINGDSSISVGDIITIEIPKTSGLTKTTIQPEPLVNGNYLVNKVHHRIQVSNLGPKYTQTLNLVRGLYQQ